MKFNCFIILLLLTNVTIFANNKKPQITTSIAPLAAIVAMLVQDKADIKIIATTIDCPHHYHLKPSDLNKVKNADIIIYIDDQFDGFTAKLVRIYNKNIIKISDFNNIRIINNNDQPNWHIWLDLPNVIIMLEKLSIILAKQFPEINAYIDVNLKEAKKQIENLAKIKQEKLSRLSDVILLSDSLEYFFVANNRFNIERLYYINQKSLRYLSNLQQLLNNSKNKCIILSQNQDARIYQKFKATIIVLESENWVTTQMKYDLFYSQYLKMINQITQCSNY